MIEPINIENLELVSNYCLVKLDANYDIREIEGPNGTKVILQLIDFTSTGVQVQSITGTVLKAPKSLKFHVELKTHQKGMTISGDEYESLMRNSMPWDCSLDLKEGDRVVFDVKEVTEAEDSGLLVKNSDGDIYVLIPYYGIYCKEVDGEIIPLNGNVIFVREQQENITESGLIIIERNTKYKSQNAKVLRADEPVKKYLEKGAVEPVMELPEQTDIIIQKGFGYRIADDTFAGDLKDFEVIKRRHILAIIE